MMHGREKSDLAIVAGKPANKAEQSAAESVERRAGTKGNANQPSTCRTQSRISVSQALERIRQAFAVTHPRWEPYAGKPHVRCCAGGRGMKRACIPRHSRPVLRRPPQLVSSGSEQVVQKITFAATLAPIDVPIPYRAHASLLSMRL